MRNKILVGVLLIVIGAVLAILGIPVLAMEDHFSSENFGTTTIYIALLLGGFVFILGGIVSMVTKNESGQDYVENVWPQPTEKRHPEKKTGQEDLQEKADTGLH